MTIGRKILMIRSKAGLTREEFSRRSGVSLNSLENYEHEKTFPMWKPLCKIAIFFGMTLSELMEGVDSFYA